ncbi:MAG TPA: deoxyguanosinetriphosphate triphosphohydrolase [Candidatus Monoglobus merdigallinarum]|uniref:Deoxyguanosinetriphosphate triphosphohydrolase n=1 Tax=Candidatus Monoglobus merdigallinarum TaxID=2838698 RepID=A0A9D1PSI2_9FIRM|nr:deoxyguanosinetriphosphate triphosphohydrolase [Candidatus Monoglobus merdigallinarum]
MTVRELTEKREREFLSEYAVFSDSSKGRAVLEQPCDIRTVFQRDRDRIIHSKAFRRLKHKTQVFIAPLGDHYRTRLTHTLEVSQIARTIARALSLNEDLTEAISLGHDLGHTPFGHMGERVLDMICNGGFKHNEQSLRVVDVLESGRGLNLTYEVRDGIAHHTGGIPPETLEGRIVALADKIAYINHDIDDSIRGGILSEEDIPSEFSSVLGNRHSVRIDTMIKATIKASGDDIRMEPEVFKAMMGLRQFMFDNVYLNRDLEIASEETKARNVIEGLFSKFIENIDLIPAEARETSHTEDKTVIVRDYIAGMSDPFAVARYEELFVPRFWVK